LQLFFHLSALGDLLTSVKDKEKETRALEKDRDALKAEVDAFDKVVEDACDAFPLLAKLRVGISEGKLTCALESVKADITKRFVQVIRLFLFTRI